MLSSVLHKRHARFRCSRSELTRSAGLCPRYAEVKCQRRRVSCIAPGRGISDNKMRPQDRSKRFTLYFPDRPVHSDTISASLGSNQPYATRNARRLLVHISTTVYSQVLIYSAGWLEQCRVKKMPKHLTPQYRIRTRVLVVESPKLYP